MKYRDKLLDSPLTTEKNSNKIEEKIRCKSFGFQVLGFGSGGGGGAQFVEATGGTITTSGDYKIHTFTGDGTFTVTAAGNEA